MGEQLFVVAVVVVTLLSVVCCSTVRTKDNSGAAPWARCVLQVGCSHTVGNMGNFVVDDGSVAASNNAGA